MAQRESGNQRADVVEVAGKHVRLRGHQPRLECSGNPQPHSPLCRWPAKPLRKATRNGGAELKRRKGFSPFPPPPPPSPLRCLKYAIVKFGLSGGRKELKIADKIFRNVKELRDL